MGLTLLIFFASAEDPVHLHRQQSNFMAKKLYIGGLAWATTDDTLHAHFAALGPVASAKVVTNREDGRSRGFGFVEMENDADADKAVESLNGTELDGRSISVSEARPQTDRPARTGGGGGFGGGARGGSRGFDRR